MVKPHVLALLFGLLGIFLAARADAWVERTVKSDSATIDLARDGSAVVTHEILLGVRGGPLPEIAVEPVDEDAELLDGATVTRARSGHAAGLPLPLSATKAGTRVVLHVVGLKGLRSGTYQVKFSYRTNLEEAGKIAPGTKRTIVEWTGPSFADGIDSARAVFRVPRGPSPPRLVSARPGSDPVTITDDADGVFLGTFHRAVDKDELEVVRPHMAKGEAVTWRITVDGSTFDARAAPRSEEPLSAVQEVPVKANAPRRAADHRVLWAIASGLALLLSVVVAAKSRWVEEACRRRGAVARPLLPFAGSVRGFFAGAFALGAVLCVEATTEPLLAAGALLVAMALSTHLPPRVSPALRGPGKWVRLEAEAAFESRRPSERLPGRFVDAGTAIGFVVFAALLSAFVTGAVFVLRKSSYEALSLGLSSALLFPVFCTGRSGELPPSAWAAPQELLEWLSNALGGPPSLEVHPLGRVPQGASEHDELRLFVSPKNALPGFVAFEAGLDFHQGILGLLPLPYVIVRVVENSEAAEALPKGLLWTRGRNADERVAVLRPKIPSRKVTLELLQHLARRVSVRTRAEKRQRRKPSAARSAGKGDSTAKAGTTSSPAHAT